MTRAPDVNSSLRPAQAHTPSDRVPAPQAPDAVELSPDAQSHALLLSQQHNSFGFISSWIAQHAGPCAISHSSTPPQTPLQNHRSASHPLGATAAETLAQPHTQALHSRLLSAPSADGLSDAFPHYPYPPPSICSANSAQGEPSSQCSVNSIHSYPSNHPPRSKQQPNYFRHRGVHHTHSSAGGSGHAGSFAYKAHQSSKQGSRQNQNQNHRRSYSGSPFSSSGVHHPSTKSNSASWRSSGPVQPPHGPPPSHMRPLSSYEARHLSSPPCLPQQPPPPALPEAYAVPRHSDQHRSIHYSHPVHHSYSGSEHIPGPPPLPEATAVSAWGHRPPPPPARHGSQRPAPPPPPPAASAGRRSASQPNSLHASPHPDPLAMQQREAAPPPPPLPQTPPHERPHWDLDRFLQAVDRLWAAPPPPAAPVDDARSLQRDPSCSQDHLDSSAAGHISRQPSDPASPSDRGCLHRPCNPMDNSNGSEGNDTIDSALPEAGGGAQPAPATLADVWSRVQESSSFGLEVPCSAKGSFSCAYFVPHLSALHIVATVLPDDHQAGLDTLFYDSASPLPPEVLRGGRMHEYAVDEAATDGTAEDSGTDPHAIGGDGDTVPSPGCGGMFTDSSGFLHSGAPSTSRGSVMHEACCNTDTSHTEPCLSRSDLADLPPVFSSRVDDAIVNTSPRALSQPATKASLRLVANWAAEGPCWERPPMYLHVQELCGAVAPAGGQAKPGAVSGHTSPVPAAGAPAQGRSASAASSRSATIPCPAALSATPLRNIHPSSWFAILWHPLCRIPDSDLRARFITYHEVGCAGIEPLHQHGSGSSAAAAAAAGGGTSGGLSGASAMGPPPLPTGMQGAPRIVGALVDIGDDGGNWMVPTVVGPDGCVHQCAPGEERQKLVAMLRGAADALSTSTLFAEMADGPQALPFVHHDHKFVRNLQEA